MRRKRLFLSYSRKDKEVVTKVQRLLELGGSHVFRDEESIRPGKRWKAVITRNINKAHKMLVFWTASAAKSRWVKKGVQRSNQARKGCDSSPARSNTSVTVENTARCYLGYVSSSLTFQNFNVHEGLF
jgi:TIR domain-containing protein